MLNTLIITERKLENTFPVSQIHIDGYSKPYKLDRNRNGGGLVIYVREDIPNSMLTKHNFPENIEGLFVELNFKKTKWLLGGMYHPPSQPHQYFFNTLDKTLDVYSDYKNVLLISDFNAQIRELHLDTFLYQHDLANINKGPTCYKNSENPSCIDFILSNRPKSFFKTNIIFTGLSDFHKLVLSGFKTTFPKSKLKEITYRNFKNVSEEYFNQELRKNLREKFVKNYAFVENVSLDTLNKYAHPKKKLIRANHGPYITKLLRKAIVKGQIYKRFVLKKRRLNH